MKILLAACVLALATACHAQMPNSPGAVKAFALNAGLDSRYSFTNSSRELAPRVGIDYRLNNVVRVGISYTHPIQLVLPADVPGKPPAPRQSNSVAVSLNFKVFQRGKVR